MFFIWTFVRLFDSWQNVVFDTFNFKWGLFYQFLYINAGFIKVSTSPEYALFKGDWINILGYKK